MISPSEAAAFAKIVDQAQDILICSHLNPDGDALGSSLAIFHYLKGIGKTCEIINTSPIPYNMKFLPGVGNVKQAPEHPGHDLAIVTDLDNLDRLGRCRPFIEECPTLILIDHHVPHSEPGDLRIVHPEEPAAAMIVYDLLTLLEADITADIANCLLTGIVTDTGSYRFQNTTAACLEASSKLLEHGGSMNLIAEEVYSRKSIQSVELLGRMLSKMEMTESNQIAWSVLSQQDFTEIGGREEDTEGLINEMMNIGTVEIAALLRQPPNGRVRASIRTRGSYDATKVAQVFEGGGHRNAAGCVFNVSIEEAERLLVEELVKCLAS